MCERELFSSICLCQLSERINEISNEEKNEMNCIFIFVPCLDWILILVDFSRSLLWNTCYVSFEGIQRISTQFA